MDNNAISDFLEKIAFFLTVKGDNAFKVRAYDRAARTVKKYEIPVEKLVETGEVTTIPGVGKGIATEIEDIVKNNRSGALQTLLQKYPETLYEIVTISGVGPKKAVFLYNEAQIESLEDLERAARGGLLEELKGFGRKSQAQIIQGIELKRKALEHTSIGLALPFAWDVIQKFKNGGFQQACEVGELRRRTETVRNISVLVGCNQKNIEKIDFFPYKLSQNNEGNWIVKDDEEQMQAEIICCSPEEFAARLLLLTGSEIHVNLLQEKLTEAGIDINAEALKNEESAYGKLGLDWIPPEVREDGTEFEEYVTGKSPKLVELSHIQGDLQMHSRFSDGIATIEDMAKKAMSLGYKYIALTDHSRSLHIAGGLQEEDILEQHREIDRLNIKFAGSFIILKGAEVDILSDGSLDYPDEILKKFDFVLASIHMGMRMSRDKMTQRVVKALRHPLVHCLAHPSGRLIGRRPEFDMDWGLIFEVLKEEKKAVEINAHPARLDLNYKRCKIAGDMGIPIFINTDAHSPAQLELMEYGVYVARRGWLEKENILNIY
ncbi:MAG: DNA polymerase/3'-5' exonuclease PolX [Vulcanimicrobiota bacterium]